MVLRRMTTSLRNVSSNLRDQNWTAIGIEFVLVVVGVFLGITAANWNQQRQAESETALLLSQLQPELRDMERFLGSLDEYYDITGRYAAQAFAAWEGDPNISDRDFVIAAYQASQITAAGNNTNVWSEIFGAGNLRNVEDIGLRERIASIMTFDYSIVSLQSVATAYRQEVRKMIPDPVQAAIREVCGDRPHPQNPAMFVLPERCEPDLDDKMIEETAVALRSRTDLADELRWHRAAVANQLLNTNTLRALARDVLEQIPDSERIGTGRRPSGSTLLPVE